MAKFGDPEKGGYDPFNAISSSLSALQDPPPHVEPKPAPPPAVVHEEKHEPPPAAAPEPTPQRMSGGGEARQSAHRNRPHTGKVSAASALTTTKRFKTTREEAMRLEQASLRLAERLGVYVDVSKITRALWEFYLRHEDDILRNVPADKQLVRPSNNDAVGMAEFDEQLADLVDDGLLVASMRPRNRR